MTSICRCVPGCGKFVIDIWDCAECRKHVCDLETNCTSLGTARSNLITVRKDKQDIIQTAGSGKVLRETVTLWLKDVRTALSSVDEMLGTRESPLQLQKPCCLCCYRDCWSTYVLGRRVVSTLARLLELENQGRGLNVDNMFSEGPVVKLPGEIEPIGAQQTTWNQFWSSFADADISIIGIQGMGGVGKSGFLAKINNEFLGDMRGFDVVISANLSAYSDTQSIRDFIGGRLELHCAVGERPDASRISAFLNRKRFVLLLDDLRDGLTLQDLGVPTTLANGSKVVFTSQKEGMWSERQPKEIKLCCLDLEDATALLERSVGEATLNSDPRIRPLAKDVAADCGFLPLALVKVGRAMSAMRDPHAWNFTIEALRNAAPDRFPEIQEVCQLLKVGYSRLGTDKHKKCLLYCSLFPKHYALEQEELIRCWIGEGLLANHGGLSAARHHGCYLISDLKRASLLMSGQDQATVTMHEMIRIMAVWLASGTGSNDVHENFFLQSGGSLTELPPGRDWSTVTRISLFEVHIFRLGDHDFRSLTTLILRSCNLTNNLKEFLASMVSLKVLDLSWCALPEFPMAILALSALQYLNLSHNNIRNLPIEFKKLKKLKLLDLSFTRLEEIPRGVISNLTELQLLNMYYCSFGEEIRQGMISRLRGSIWGTLDSQSLLEELKNLELLEDLGITVTSADAFQSLQSSPKSRCTHSILITKCNGTTSLQLSSSIMSLDALKVLHISSCPDLVALTVDPVSATAITRVRCFHNLHHVEITSCWEVKDLSWLRYANALSFLKIEQCPQLERIMSNQQPDEPFLKLKTLYLNKLPRLSGICDQALSLPLLNEITVLSCPILTMIAFHANPDRETSITVRGEEEWWDNLDKSNAEFQRVVRYQKILPQTQ